VKVSQGFSIQKILERATVSDGERHR